MRREEMAERGVELAATGTPYVEATVVRAQRPTSVRPGDRAIVHPDGVIEGFVGGVCAEGSVRAHALEVLDRDEPLLLRILPGDEPGPERTAAGPGDRDADAAGVDGAEGSVTVTNPCLSGGGIEIYLEPRRPPARLFVVGAGPVAGAIAAIGAAMGEEVVAVPPGARLRAPDGRSIRPADLGAVIAAHGRGEEAALREALQAGVGYVGLVASKRRGAAVRSALGLGGADGDRIVTPAGLALGARTPQEIALAIWAEIVARRRRDGAPPIDEVEVADGGSEVAAGPVREGSVGGDHPGLIDPVCGMTVALGPDAITVQVDGGLVAFCGSGCRSAWTEQQDAHPEKPARSRGEGAET